MAVCNNLCATQPSRIHVIGAEPQLEDIQYTSGAGHFVATQLSTGHMYRPPAENFPYSAPQLCLESRGRATNSAASTGGPMQSLMATVASLLPGRGQGLGLVSPVARPNYVAGLARDRLRGPTG